MTLNQRVKWAGSIEIADLIPLNISHVDVRTHSSGAPFHKDGAPKHYYRGPANNLRSHASHFTL